MSFRKRSSSKPSSSRGYNKFRFTNKHDVAEIESWIDHVSKMTVIMKNNLVFQDWKGRKNQSNFFCDAWERMKKRHVKLLHKQAFEEQLFIEIRQFSNGVMSRLDKQNKV